MEKKFTKRSMAKLNRMDVEAFRHAQKLPLLFILDNVRSGLNVGSIFRTADAFALEKLHLCGITAQPPHREILKTALGATESVEWDYCENILDLVARLKSEDIRVWALEQTFQSTTLSDFQPEPGLKYAVILGNEVDGVRQEVLNQCDGVLEIPQYGTKHSLNVAVSAGILAWDWNCKVRK